ncbi:MAG TPA: sulfite exporter TauE/SafE family protein [Burkholderiales bacterium]|nr:sulfite exporter TauE/SafE family protein [Burkholderiales bacterium]
MELPASLPLPLALLAFGLVSGVHCAGMCGGIVAAFSTQGREQPLLDMRALARRQLAFNAGRITSYAAAGVAAGALGSAGAYAAAALGAQSALAFAANGLLVLMGLYLLGASRLLAPLERLGTPLWRRLQPHAARALRARTLPGAYGAGALWGWLPCGLVYGALAAATLSGGAAQGGLAMLAFGLGTLPNLLAMGLAAVQLRRWTSRRGVRAAVGGVVLGFGAWGLVHAGGLAGRIAAHLAAAFGLCIA